MNSADRMDEALKTGQREGLPLRRFALAVGTYAIGLAMLAFCAQAGLLDWGGWWRIAAAFAAVNALFASFFVSGVNRRLADPYMTVPQVFVATVLMVYILIQGPELQVIAVPYYSVLFVFAMLRMRRAQILALAAFVLVTYGLAEAVRLQRFAGALDVRREVVTSVLLVACVIWFAIATDYITGLRIRLRRSVQQLEELAAKDSLTGLWNRRHMEALFESESRKALRSGAALCACMADIDHFKAVNDTRGHQVGDQALLHVATVIGNSLRAGDELGRWGGEEFVVLLPGTRLEDAQVWAERMRGALHQAPFRVGGDAGVGSGTRLTVSAGIVQWRRDESLADFICRADSAMYAAKEGGRDRIQVGH